MNYLSGIKQKNLLARLAMLAAIYFVAGLVGIKAEFGGGDYQLVWPPFGIGLAALLFFGKGYWAGIAAGAGFFAVLLGLPLGGLTLSVIIGNTMGALVGVFLLERLTRFQLPMTRVRDIAALAGLACGLGALVTALFQVVAEWHAGLIERQNLFPATLAWWVPNALAGLVLTPLLLSWLKPVREKWPLRRVGEALACAIGLLLGTLFSFHSWFAYGIQNYPLAFLPYPFLVWAATRFGLRGATLGTLLVSALAIQALLHGQGPFVTASEKESLLLIGGYLAVTAIANLVLAAAVQERRLAEERLRKSEEMFQIITRHASDLIAITDASGCRLYNSDSYRHTLGDPARLPGTDAFAEIHPDDRERVKRIFRESLETGQGRRLEFRFLLADGRVRHIESIGNFVEGPPGEPGKIVTIARDITERKRVEEQLRKLSWAVEQSPASIVITDTRGVIEYVNPRFTQVTGYTGAEVIGQNVRLLKSGESPPEFYRELWSTITAGREWRGEFHNRKKNGEMFWEAAVISPIRDAEGRPTHYLAIKEDITEKKAALAAQERLEAQLRQAQKMEALGTLAGGIAHDFNNILATMIGHAELAHLTPGAPAAAREHLLAVLQAGKSAKDLVNQILTFSRQSKQERKVINLAQVVQDALKLLRATLPATVEMTVQIRGDLPPVKADAFRIHQVLMNLCANAVHAMRGRAGRLEVALDQVAVSAADARAHADLPAGLYVRLTVRDTGEGMSAEVLKRIFDPFFTTKGVGEGTGLGLSVVHGIMREHEGAIRVQSQPGAGAEFQLFFPACEAPAETQTATAEPAPLSGSGEHILFVDDDPQLAEMVQLMIEHLGYQTRTFTTATAALEYLRAQPQAVDLVLTDLTMPGMTGVDLVAELRKIRPDLPIILTTGYSGSLTPEKIRSLGFTGFITKPFQLNALGDALHRALHPS